MRRHIVVPAAGNGFRFGASMPKQYLLLQGRPVLQHALAGLRSGFPDAVIHVVLAPQDCWYDSVIAPHPMVVAARCGGATRAESVRNALEVIDAGSDDWVVVHDAVRPCLDDDSSRRLCSELQSHEVGGFLAVRVADTLKRLDDTDHVIGTQPRDHVWRAQTPQMFRYDILRKAFAVEGAELATDEAHAVERLGLRPRAVSGSATNIKITFPDDMQLAEAILAARALR